MLANFVTVQKSSQDYYPFGMIMWGRNVMSSDGYRFGFNGKEKDDEIKGSGNSLDFGERILDPRIGRWLSLDPLAMKYPAISPYTFVLNNPICNIDPDGREVKAVNEAAKTAILNTLTIQDMKFVKFDAKGIIDKTLLNQASSSSGNLEALKQLVNDERTFEVIVDNKFEYKNEKGESIQEEMGPVIQGEPNDAGIFNLRTGEEGFLGVTQTPGSEPEKYNSPDETIKITINSGLSEEGQAESFSHEGYGHGYLYSKGEEHKHDVENMTEKNEKLREQVPARIKETEKNYKENKKK